MTASTGALRRRFRAEYMAWKNMRCRCTCPTSSSYAEYGARGIKCCKQWALFENFLGDMGPKPSPDYSLDRIDPNGNYEPSNCRWATAQQQSINRRTPKHNTSGYRGVSFNSKAQKWQARIGLDGTIQSVGFFFSREEAALAYNRKAVELHGPYAVLNEVAA